MLAVAGLAAGAPSRPGPRSPAVAGQSSAYVFPIPGDRVATPGTQIAFRGVPASQLGVIQVTGSQSGSHSGTVAADSDGQGGSFIPSQPFTPGEVVTVTTGLNVVGAVNGSFQFTIAEPAGAQPFGPRPTTPRVTGDVWTYRSRPDLRPAAVQVLMRSRRTARGDIFIAPFFGPIRGGPMILGPNANLVWFKPVPPRDWVTDFRVQRYQGKPVLTWYQGHVTHGLSGVGEGVIYDTSYRQMAVVTAGNGLNADLHEFEITPWNTALLTSYYSVYWDTRSLHGAKHETTIDSVVQEIDIPTGLVLFQWDSLDHVPLSDSYLSPPKTGWFEPTHVNSVEPDYDGNLIISARHTFAAYKVDHRTAATIWTLGGKHSSFAMGPGARFAFQHDVRVHGPGDQFVTLFDDGAGTYVARRQSRGLELKLDLVHMTAVAVGQFLHSPALLASYMGGLQALSNVDAFVGWGQQPYFTEFDASGRELFDARFVGYNVSYRAARYAWTGTPHTLPALATHNSGGSTIVWVSWNGATGVGSWRVLGGGSAATLRPVAGSPKHGFETRIAVRRQRFVAVQALDTRGSVLATTAAVATR